MVSKITIVGFLLDLSMMNHFGLLQGGTLVKGMLFIMTMVLVDKDLSYMVMHRLEPVQLMTKL